MKAIALLIAFSVSACVIESDPDPEPGPDPGGSSSSYENQIYLECNGSVLVDRTFTSQSACEDFRASNDFYCAGIKLTFSC
jgi:hypothetical protein